ncbi:MAG: c-type cytochrome [Candidatus Korobacteraceae bacterium]
MKYGVMFLILATLAVLVAAACSSPIGRPGPPAVRPDQMANFAFLYAENCAGCHGFEGKGGASTALSDPTFLAIADDAAIRRTASNGVPGTPMPAFAQSAGGMLTDMQIGILVRGVRSWARPDLLRDANPPSYAAQPPGDPQRGAEVYATFCSACHGPNGRGGEKASSIVDRSYLSLVSDQYLRTMVIAGRPELGAPDWRGDVPGRPMSAQEVSDVVAWLSAQRPANSGPQNPIPEAISSTKGLP